MLEFNTPLTWPVRAAGHGEQRGRYLKIVAPVVGQLRSEPSNKNRRMRNPARPVAAARPVVTVVPAPPRTRPRGSPAQADHAGDCNAQRGEEAQVTSGR